MNVMLFSGVLLALATAPSFAQGEQPNGGAGNGQQQRKLPQQQGSGQQQGDSPAARRRAAVKTTIPLQHIKLRRNACSRKGSVRQATLFIRAMRYPGNIAPNNTKSMIGARVGSKPRRAAIAGCG
ncbi:hypothetical protein SODG_001060 [Sodalis praecaptivus]